MNKGGVRQGTTTDKRCERKKQGDKKASERRAKEEQMQDKRVKGEKAEGERKQQRKMDAPETASPHQNLCSDADGRDEMRYYQT